MAVLLILVIFAITMPKRYFRVLLRPASLAKRHPWGDAERVSSCEIFLVLPLFPLVG